MSWSASICVSVGGPWPELLGRGGRTVEQRLEEVVQRPFDLGSRVIRLAGIEISVRRGCQRPVRARAAKTKQKVHFGSRNGLLLGSCCQAEPGGWRLGFARGLGHIWVWVFCAEDGQRYGGAGRGAKVWLGLGWWCLLMLSWW